MKCFIYYLTNSGLFFWSQGTGILIDGLFGRGPYQCFSPFPPELHRQMTEKQGIFGHLHGLFFTHIHGDHFDPDMVYYMINEQKDIMLYAADCPENTINPDESQIADGYVKKGPFELFFYETMHQGNEKKDSLYRVKHNMIVIRIEEEEFLVAGDGVFEKKQYDRIKRFHFKVVFCNPLHLAAPESADEICRLNPERVFITHLPRREDDRFDYYGLAEQKRKKVTIGKGNPEIPDPMAWIDDHRPDWL